MQIFQDATNHHPNIPRAEERRQSPRIHTPFPTVVRGTDSSGKFFRSQTAVDNISTDGLYLRLMPCLEPGTRLSVLIHISNSQIASQKTFRLQLEGEVLRVEPKPGGSCGVAMLIKHKKFV